MGQEAVLGAVDSVPSYVDSEPGARSQENISSGDRRYHLIVLPMSFFTLQLAHQMVLD